MSALRLIKKIEFDGVTQLDVEDIFTTDFRVYQIVIESERGFYNGYLQFITASGNLVTKNNYTYGLRNLKPTAGSSASQSNSDANGIKALPGTPTSTTSGSMGNVWVFSPAHNDSFTYVSYEGTCNATRTAYRQTVGAGSLKDLSSITGFRVNTQSSANLSGQVRIYGIRYEEF